MECFPVPVLSSRLLRNPASCVASRKGRFVSPLANRTGAVRGVSRSAVRTMRLAHIFLKIAQIILKYRRLYLRPYF